VCQGGTRKNYRGKSLTKQIPLATQRGEKREGRQAWKALISGELYEQIKTEKSSTYRNTEFVSLKRRIVRKEYSIINSIADSTIFSIDGENSGFRYYEGRKIEPKSFAKEGGAT
jgi:hypothetical protein